MKHQVLILDDEEDVRRAIRLQLDGTRFEVLEAAGAEEAVALLRENALTVDVIICDIRMPKISGTEVVAYCREQYPSTPVIVLTGHPDLDLAVGFIKEGVVDYLVKPVGKQELVAAVEKAAQRRTMFDQSY